MKQLKKMLYSISILFCSMALSACGKPTGVENHLLVRAQLDSLSGIWDITANDWLVPNKYQDISPFSEGLALCKRDNKWGFVDTTGKEVIPPAYDDAYATGFIGGRAFVHINGKWGMIDKKGAIVLEPQFDDVYLYGEGFYSVKRDEVWNFISTDGKLLLPDWYTSIISFHGGYASAQKQFFVEERSDYDYVSCIVNNKGHVSCNDSLFSNIQYWGGNNAIATLAKDKKEVLIDTSGKILFQVLQDAASFDKGGDPATGYVIIKTNTSKYGLLNPSGKLTLDTIYDDMSNVHEGCISFKKENKWGLADSTGKVIMNPEFNGAVILHEGLAIEFIKDKCGFIDKTGKWVIPPTFDKAMFFYNGLANVTIKNKSCIIDKTGKFVIPCEYDFLSPVEANGCFAFKKDSKFGIIDTTGKELTKPKFENLNPIMKMKSGSMYRN